MEETVHLHGVLSSGVIRVSSASPLHQQNPLSQDGKMLHCKMVLASQRRQAYL